MSGVDELVEELRARRGITVKDRGGDWLVRVPRGPDLECEITFPQIRGGGLLPNFVWCASVKRIADGVEVWRSDTQEHVGASYAQEEVCMASALRRFIERVADPDGDLSIWGRRALQGATAAVVRLQKDIMDDTSKCPRCNQPDTVEGKINE